MPDALFPMTFLCFLMSFCQSPSDVQDKHIQPNKITSTILINQQEQNKEKSSEQDFNHIDKPIKQDDDHYQNHHNHHKNDEISPAQ